MITLHCVLCLSSDWFQHYLLKHLHIPSSIAIIKSTLRVLTKSPFCFSHLLSSLVDTQCVFGIVVDCRSITSLRIYFQIMFEDHLFDDCYLLDPKEQLKSVMFGKIIRQFEHNFGVHHNPKLALNFSAINPLGILTLT